MILSSSQLLQIYKSKDSLPLNGSTTHRAVKIKDHPRYTNGRITTIKELSSLLEIHNLDHIDSRGIFKTIVLIPNENAYTQLGAIKTEKGTENEQRNKVPHQTIRS